MELIQLSKATVVAGLLAVLLFLFFKVISGERAATFFFERAVICCGGYVAVSEETEDVPALPLSPLIRLKLC